MGRWRCFVALSLGLAGCADIDATREVAQDRSPRYEVTVREPGESPRIYLTHWRPSYDVTLTEFEDCRTGKTIVCPNAKLSVREL